MPAATEDALVLLLNDGEADTRATTALTAEQQPPPQQKPDVHAWESAAREEPSEKARKSDDVGNAVDVAVTDSLTRGVEGGGEVGGEESKEVLSDGQLRWRLWHKGEVRKTRTCAGLAGREEGRAAGKKDRGARVRDTFRTPTCGIMV